MNNIFQIQQEYLTLISQIEENEGNLTTEIEQSLLSNEAEFNNKAENYVKMIRHWDGEIDTIKKEIERLTNLKKRKESSIESLKNNLSEALKSRGIDKLNIGTSKLSFRPSEAVIILDENEIPSQFVHSVTTETIDKKGLKKYLETNGDIEDVAYIDKRQNLQIK